MSGVLKICHCNLSDWDYSEYDMMAEALGRLRRIAAAKAA